MRNDSRVAPHILIGYGTLLGLGMIALAVAWAGALRGQDLGAWFPRAHWLADVALGTLTGTLFALLAWQLLNAVPALRQIERLVIRTLEMRALRYYHAVLFGLLAGIPEEILFRGALQPTLGLLLTSILFGALHAITPAYFVYATAAGAMLGVLADWSGALWMPVTAHAVIDLLMFALLIRRWRRRHTQINMPL
jgi:membrane protease YdiL (CAAX protease family)